MPFGGRRRFRLPALTRSTSGGESIRTGPPRCRKRFDMPRDLHDHEKPAVGRGRVELPAFQLNAGTGGTSRRRTPTPADGLGGRRPGRPDEQRHRHRHGQPGTSFTGTWAASSAPSPFGANSIYGTGAATDTYRWTLTIPATGAYQVYVVDDRPSPVDLGEVHGSTCRGTFTTPRSQQSGGGQWQLRHLPAHAGTGGTSRRRTRRRRTLSVDAARFVPASGLPALTVIRAGTGTGTVTSVPGGIDRRHGLSQGHRGGTVVNLVGRRRRSASSFVAWTADADRAYGVVDVTVTRPCTATFTSSDVVIDPGEPWTSFTGTGAASSAPRPVGVKLNCTRTGKASTTTNWKLSSSEARLVTHVNVRWTSHDNWSTVVQHGSYTPRRHVHDDEGSSRRPAAAGSSRAPSSSTRALWSRAGVGGDHRPGLSRTRCAPCRSEPRLPRACGWPRRRKRTEEAHEARDISCRPVVAASELGGDSRRLLAAGADLVVMAYWGTRGGSLLLGPLSLDFAVPPSTTVYGSMSDQRPTRPGLARRGWTSTGVPPLTGVSPYGRGLRRRGGRGGFWLLRSARERMGALSLRMLDPGIHPSSRAGPSVATSGRATPDDQPAAGSARVPSTPGHADVIDSGRSQAATRRSKHARGQRPWLV